MQEKIQIDGITLTLSSKIENNSRWIGQQEVLRQLSACWLVIDDRDLPLAPRLVGPPGRQNSIGDGGSQGTESRPLHLPMHRGYTAGGLVSHPVLSSEGKLSYHASPLVTAMIRGAVCILDEGNRMK